MEGGEFIGIDPEREARVSRLGRFVDAAAGEPVPPYRWFRAIPAAAPGASVASPPRGAARSGRELPGLLLGWEFSQQFKVSLGQVLTLATTWRDPETGKERGRSRRFTVTGFFRTGVYDFDLNFFFLPLEAARQLKEGTGAKGLSYTGVALRPGLTAEEGKRLLAGDPLCQGLPVHTWKDWRGGILRAVASQRNILLVMYSFIMILASATVVMTLVMMVGEKREEIGIFKSLGSSSWEAGAIFLGCGLGITLLGGAIGTILGCLFVSQIEAVVRGLSWLMGVDVFARSIYQLDHLPVSLTPFRVFLVVGPALALGALSSLIPAWVAARKRPVEVMFRR